jgi:isopenicillin N synthase-like dioxygenase
MATPVPEIPIFDLSDFLAGKDSAAETCKQMADYIHRTGILVIRDPRVHEENNNTFIDMMERYYDLPDEVKLKDIRPEIHYQLGATPENTESCRCFQTPSCMEEISTWPAERRPHLPVGPDPKWRFFWRLGKWPEKTQFPALNADQVIPDGFPEWSHVMDLWGKLMLTAVSTVAAMVAVGLDLPRDTFTKRMEYGPHLLAPTGSNLNKYSDLGTIFAGYHTDLNFLTIHGKSRFPGLNAWLRDGTRMPVRVPDGCLLVQAGKQIEYLTGGFITAGFHEVVSTEATRAAIAKAKEEGRICWRVSSTLFSHIGSDEVLQPLEPFRTPEAVAKYPSVLTGDQVQNELNVIKLGKGVAEATATA